MQNHFVHDNGHIATTDQNTHRQAIEQSLHIIGNGKKIGGFALGRLAMQGQHRRGQFRHQRIIGIIRRRGRAGGFWLVLGLGFFLRDGFRLQKNFRHDIFGQQTADFMKGFLLALVQIDNRGRQGLAGGSGRDGLNSRGGRCCIALFVALRPCIGSERKTSITGKAPLRIILRCTRDLQDHGRLAQTHPHAGNRGKGLAGRHGFGDDLLRINDR